MFNPAHMSIEGRTRNFRPSKRQDLFEGQWQKKRFEQHRQKVKTAEPRVDDKLPISTTFQHVQVKQKKHQKESERYVEVMMENLILLRHLAEIAMSKRIDDGRQMKPIHWKDYYGTILLMRMEQVERLRKQLSDGGHGLNINGHNKPESNNDDNRKKKKKKSRRCKSETRLPREKDN